MGSLCSSDLILADALRSAGLPTSVLRAASERELQDRSHDLFPHLRNEDVVFFRSADDLLRRLRGFDVLFSFTSTLGFALAKRMYLYPMLQRMGWPPYINISTGADITERAVESSWEGSLERFTMRHAFAQAVPPFPEAIRSAARLRLANACLLPPIQITLASTDDEPSNSSAWRFRRSRDELLLLHPSHFDWGLSDPGARASTKGNDRFLRALAEFIPKAGRPVRLLALDRGSDREPAKALVRTLGLEPYVEWRESLTRDDLFCAMREADLIVDQFDIGGLGGIAREALHVGRPVLIYVQPNAERLAYDELSPVLSAHTVEEILASLHEAADPEQLQALARRAREWTRARPTHVLLSRYLFYATVATGYEAADFGWGRPYGHPWGSLDD